MMGFARRLLTRPLGLALLVVALVALPFVAPSRYWLYLMTDVFIFAIFAMSYDLLMGYTGIVSFGHALFLGTGAYGTGILMVRFGWPLWAAVLTALAASAAFAVLTGALSLRVKGVHFSMITLAFAELGYVAVQKFDWITGGADGLTGVASPAWLSTRVSFYYFALVLTVLVFLGLARVVESPFGRVLLAIRENESRAAALGYHPFSHKLVATTVSGLVAAVAGVLYALFYNFVSPVAIGVSTTLDALLMTIIGGAGTLAGPAFGAGLVRILGNVLGRIFDRWLLVFGLVYILIVAFLPYGLAGTLFHWVRQRGERAPAG